MDFSAAEKDRGMKVCMRVRLSGPVFSHFGELWLAESHCDGITSGMGYKSGAPGQQRTARHCNTSWMSYIEIAVRHSELGVAALLKAVWWDLIIIITRAQQ